MPPISDEVDSNDRSTRSGGDVEAVRHFISSHQEGVVANVVQTQLAATLITDARGFIGTCANANDGVKLGVATKAGKLQALRNDGAEIADVWPSTDGTINGGAADAVDANSLKPRELRIYISTSALNWDLYLSIPDSNSPAGLIEVVTGANVITAAESGTTFILNAVDAFISTLPLPAANLEYWFRNGALQVTGGNHTVVTNASANIIEGSLSSPEVSALVAVVAAADSINFIADLAVHGDLAHLWCDGTHWYLDGHCFVQDGMTTTG